MWQTQSQVIGNVTNVGILSISYHPDPADDDSPSIARNCLDDQV